MPFTFNRDKQKPSDKLGGDDFLSGIRKQFDQDRKMFFDKSPAWESTPSASGFSRGGFFDEEPGRGLGIRSHLDDLAFRHPEFASSLRRGPGWAEPAGGSSQWEPGPAGAPTAPGAEGGVAMETDACRDATDERRDEAGPLRGRTRLAATATDVPGHSHQGEEPDGGGRGQRSWSAPPDSRAPPPTVPARFVSRLDFQPAPAQAPAQQPAQPAQQPGPHQQQASSEGGPTVRHIPIFVEGRDEPVVPREPPVPAQEPAASGPQPARSFNASPQPFRSSNSAPSPQAPPPPTRSQQAPPPVSPPPAAAPSPAPDGLSRVAVVSAAVAELRQRVAAFEGSESRSDKQYLLLDELLTRRLLELDDIEPAGREDVRTARKQAIRDVQECISQLEAKVPLPTTDCPPDEASQSQGADSEMPASEMPASEVPAS